MKIIDIREAALPINSTLRNAVFDFSEMTTSVVAVITDVVRNGKPVVGYAFNSTGRYACGAQMRAKGGKYTSSSRRQSDIGVHANNESSGKPWSKHQHGYLVSCHLPHVRCSRCH